MLRSQYKYILERTNEDYINDWQGYNSGNSCHNDFMDYLYRYLDNFAHSVNYDKRYRMIQTTLSKATSSKGYDWMAFNTILQGFVETTNSVTPIEEKPNVYMNPPVNLRSYKAWASIINNCATTIGYYENVEGEEKKVTLDLKRIIKDLGKYPSRSMYSHEHASSSKIYKDMLYYFENYCLNE